MLAILAPIISRFIQLAVSRQREYLADASSVELTRNPYGLERALAKIGGDQEVLEVANRGTQHMYAARRGAAELAEDVPQTAQASSATTGSAAWLHHLAENVTQSAEPAAGLCRSSLRSGTFYKSLEQTLCIEHGGSTFYERGEIGWRTTYVSHPIPASSQ